MKTDTTRFLLAIGGLGGLLYGIDFGIIAVSMPYIKALGIYTDAEVSWIVGAVMFGGILASASAGVLCDRLGRQRMIVASAALFLLAVPIVCFSGTTLAVMRFWRNRLINAKLAGPSVAAAIVFLCTRVAPAGLIFACAAAGTVLHRFFA